MSFLIQQSEIMDTTIYIELDGSLVSDGSSISLNPNTPKQRQRSSWSPKEVPGLPGMHTCNKS